MNYIDDYQSCSRTYATLVCYTGRNPPEIVSDTLGMEPSSVSYAGDSPRKKVNGWFLSSQDLVHSRDSRRHIDYLISAIASLKEELNTLRGKGVEIGISCFWESATGNGGPMMSPSQMKALGDLEIEIWWDIWFSGE